MTERGSHQGSGLDRRTLGLILFGFSLVLGVSGLVSANLELQVAFGNAPAGVPANLGNEFNYSVSERVGAAMAFVSACAAMFAAAGGAAMFLRRGWGALLAVIGLGVGAAAVLINVLVAPHSVFIIGPILDVVWMVALILLISGFRPRLTRPRGAAGGASWMEEAFAADHDDEAG